MPSPAKKSLPDPRRDLEKELANVSPYLDRIERYAKHIVSDAASAAAAAKALSSRPGFETRAEAALHDAEAELIASLEKIRGALKTYNSKTTAA